MKKETQKKEKKQSALSELLEYAGSFKILTYLSLILSALSSVLALMPFVFLSLLVCRRGSTRCWAPRGLTSRAVNSSGSPLPAPC